MTVTTGMTKKQAYALIMTYVLGLLTVIALVVWVNHTIKENDKQWCEMLSPLNSAYKSAPVTSEVGRKVREAIHNRAVDFGCEEQK